MATGNVRRRWGFLHVGRGQSGEVQPEFPAKGGVGVVTQPLLVADGAEEEIEGPGRRVALAESTLANQTLIQPTKLGWNFAELQRNEDFFVDHF